MSRIPTEEKQTMSKITQVSEGYIKNLKKREAFRSSPYQDSGKVWTIGYGTTRYFDTGKKVTGSDRNITEQEADRLLRGHINHIFAPLVDKLLRDDVDQSEFDAVVDFVYNAGATYVNKRGEVKYFNLFDKVNRRVPRLELETYWEGLAITAGGRVLPGLIKRRKEEVDEFYS